MMEDRILVVASAVCGGVGVRAQNKGIGAITPGKPQFAHCPRHNIRIGFHVGRKRHNSIAGAFPESLNATSPDPSRRDPRRQQPGAKWNTQFDVGFDLALSRLHAIAWARDLLEPSPLSHIGPCCRSRQSLSNNAHSYLDMIGFDRGLYGSAVAFKIRLNGRRPEQMAPGNGAHRNSGKEWSELV